MANPTSYTPGYSFDGFQEINPTVPLPAQQVDNELADISDAINNHKSAIQDVRRSDGALVNGIVTPDSLSPSIKAFLGVDGVTYPFRATVRVVATSDIVLAGRQDIDGVMLAAKDRVLLVAQDDAAFNGIWVVGDVWARAADLATAADFNGPIVVPVAEGSVGRNKIYSCAPLGPVVVGETDLVFAEGVPGFVIADKAVTNTKLADMAALTVKANATNSDTAPQDVALADGDVLKRAGTVLVGGKIENANVQTPATPADAIDANKLRAPVIGSPAMVRVVGAKIAETISIKDRGALGTGADDTGYIQDVIAGVAAAGGGAVEVPVPSNNYGISAALVVPAGVNIRGKGARCSFRPRATMDHLFEVTGGLSSLSGISVNNNANRLTRAVHVNKPWNNLPVRIRDVYIDNCPIAINWEDGDCLDMSGCTLIANGQGIYFANNGMNSRITNNYILGGSGILLRKVTQGNEGTVISGNSILPAVASPSFCIHIEAALHVTIRDNILDQVKDGNAVQIDAQSSVDFVYLLDNWYGRQAGASGANYGVYVSGPVRDLTIRGGTFVGWQQAGVRLLGASGSPIVRPRVEGVNFYAADPSARDVQMDYVQGVAIDRSRFSGTASVVEGTGCSGRIDLCDWPAVPALTSLKMGRQRSGVVLENRGTATCAQTTRLAVVTHGLSYTPAATDIRVQGVSAFPTNAIDEFIVANITSTDFQVYTRADPGVGGAAFAWIADLTR